MVTTIAAPEQFADTRLRQIRRLVALQSEYAAEFNDQGCRLTRRAIFAMVLDCRAAGVPPASVADALAPRAERVR